jgi:hypothetical protein
MIAATALEHDLTIVTRNVKDFAGQYILDKIREAPIRLDHEYHAPSDSAVRRGC